MDGLMDYDVMCVWAEGADKGLDGTKGRTPGRAAAADDPRPTKQEDFDEAAGAAVQLKGNNRVFFV